MLRHLLPFLCLAACLPALPDDPKDGVPDADADTDSDTDADSDADTDTDSDTDTDTDVAAADDDGDGFTESDGDCDDGEATVFPGAVETCDGVDQDCDQVADDGVLETFYADVDGDGFGDLATAVSGCEAPAGYVSDATDCDDARADVYPGASEVCDYARADEDCDEASNSDDADAAGSLAWYIDADGDGYGEASLSTFACDAPSGYVEYGTDCDDRDASINPGAAEVCNGGDEDCDGLTDEADAVDAATWYPDLDGDAYGGTGPTFAACDAPAGYVGDATDCDDAAGDVNPGATELCGDGVDSDCDGIGWVCDLGETSATATLGGESGEDYASQVVGLGDVDGDGWEDVGVGAPGHDTSGDNNYGAAYIVYGPHSASTSLSAAGAILLGVDNFQLGDAVSAAGDFDGDGLADFLVGHGDSSYYQFQYAYVVTGAPTGTMGIDTTSVLLKGEAEGDGAGFAVGGGTDVDGDGLDDVIIGAPYYDEGTTDVGAAYLVFGGATGTVDLSTADARITGAEYEGHLGAAVAVVGDLDGDGLPDLATAETGFGAYYVFAGTSTGDLDATDAFATVSGGPTTSSMPALADAGDVDGDGTDDLVLGEAHGEHAYLFSGPLSGTMTASIDATATFTGATQLGWSVSSVGDPDSNSCDDLLVGALSADGRDGAAYLFLGPLTGNVDAADAEVHIGGASSYTGASVSGGDLDADGVPDLLVGAYDTSEAGAAYIFSGAPLLGL